MKSLEGIAQYRISSSGVCRTQVSKDGIKWDEVPVVEMSAEGLIFSTPGKYSAGELVYLDVCIISGFSEFKMDLEGKIISMDRSASLYNCHVKFSDMDTIKRIQLDELLRGLPGTGAANMGNAGRSSLISDGEYAFNLRPKQKRMK